MLFMFNSLGLFPEDNQAFKEIDRYQYGNDSNDHIGGGMEIKVWKFHKRVFDRFVDDDT